MARTWNGYWPLYLMLLLVVSSSQEARGTTKPGSRHPAILALGSVHGAALFCRVQTSPSGEDTGTIAIALTFSRKSDGHSTYKSMPQIVGFPDSIRIKVADFINAGHKQLFVSATMGHVETHIYDFDGNNVKSLYESEGGRVGVRLIWKRNRGWRLQESWGRNQFLDFDDLGIGYDMGRDGIVRYLHWDGRRFVPDKPGETRIIRNRSV